MCRSLHVPISNVAIRSCNNCYRCPHDSTIVSMAVALRSNKPWMVTNSMINEVIGPCQYSIIICWGTLRSVEVVFLHFLFSVLHSACLASSCREVSSWSEYLHPSYVIRKKNLRHEGIKLAIPSARRYSTSGLLLTLHGSLVIYILPCMSLQGKGTNPLAIYTRNERLWNRDGSCAIVLDIPNSWWSLEPIRNSSGT